MTLIKRQVFHSRPPRKQQVWSGLLPGVLVSGAARRSWSRGSERGCSGAALLVAVGQALAPAGLGDPHEPGVRAELGGVRAFR